MSHHTPCPPPLLCVLEYNDGTPPLPVAAASLEQAQQLGCLAAEVQRAMCTVLIVEFDQRAGDYHLLLEGDVLERIA